MAHADLGDQGMARDNPYSEIKHQVKSKRPGMPPKGFSTAAPGPLDF